MSDARRIVIIANHQHSGLAVALRALLPSANVVSFDIADLARDVAARRHAGAAAAASDHIVSYDIPAAFGPLSTSALRAAGRPLVLLPAFRFAGFHPDGVNINLDGGRVAGPTGVLHSRIAIAAFLAGLSVADAASLYNSLVFARLGYYAAFASERANLIRTFAVYGFDITDLFEPWAQPGCFVFDATRPRMRVLLDIARLVCGRIGLAAADGVSESALSNPLATAAMQPLFPEIAARLGMSPEGSFRGPSAPATRPVLYNLETFLGASFEVYRRIPLAALRGVDDMEWALPALLLREADFGRAAASARANEAASGEAVFMTWHGMLLGVETATGLLVQHRPWPASADSTPVAAQMHLPAAQPARLTFAGGTDVAPASRAGAVTLSQQGRFLSAPPRALALRFSADRAGDSELFLAMRRADLEILRELAAASWTTGDGATLQAEAIVLHAGFQLECGALRVDLATARLHRRQTDNGAIQIEITTPHGMHAFMRSASAPPAAMRAPQADIGVLPVAASLEQFRAQAGYRLHIHGAAELVHLPLTADLQTRLWLLDKTRPGNPLRAGRHATRITAVRARNKFVSLSPGSEGVMFDSRCVWAGHGAGSVPDAELAQAAVRIEQPLCVVHDARLHDANLRDAHHWALAAACLHILQPALPPETSLLLPAARDEPPGSVRFDANMLANLGFAGLTVVRTQAPVVRAADVTWLADSHLAAWPAGLLQNFRARVHAMHKPLAARRMIYLAPRDLHWSIQAEATEQLLQSRDFETVVPEGLSPAEQIALFASADFIVAPRGAHLSGLLFCQAGTQVLELSPDTDFDPTSWHISAKLGLHHAVLKCPVEAGELIVNNDEFRALFKVMRLMTP
jgi:hypothetical protein